MSQIYIFWHTPHVVIITILVCIRINQSEDFAHLQLSDLAEENNLIHRTSLNNYMPNIKVYSP